MPPKYRILQLRGEVGVVIPFVACALTDLGKTEGPNFSSKLLKRKQLPEEKKKRQPLAVFFYLLCFVL